MTANELQTDGPPIRIRDLASVAGLSKTKIRDDAKSGELVIRWIRCNTRKMGVIDRDEAYRYLQAIGVLS